MEKERTQNLQNGHLQPKTDQKVNIFDDLAQPLPEESESIGILREKDIIGHLKSDILNISDEAVDSGLGSVSSFAEDSLLHKRKMPKPRITPSPRKVKSHEISFLIPKHQLQSPLPKPIFSFSPLKQSSVRQSPLKASPKPKFLRSNVNSTPKKTSPRKPGGAFSQLTSTPNLTPIKRDRECVVNPFTPTQDTMKRIRLSLLDSPRYQSDFYGRKSS